MSQWLNLIRFHFTSKDLFKIHYWLSLCFEPLLCCYTIWVFLGLCVCVCVCVCIKFLVEIVELQNTRIPVLSWIYLPNLLIILKNSVSPRRVFRLPTSNHLGIFNCGSSWPLPRQTDQSLLRWISRKCILSTLSWWFKCTLNCERYCQEDKKDPPRHKGQRKKLIFCFSEKAQHLAAFSTGYYRLGL